MYYKAAKFDSDEGRYYCDFSGDRRIYWFPNSKSCSKYESNTLTNRGLVNDISKKLKYGTNNYPATIVLWSDGTKTVVKAIGDDVYDPEKGLAMAIAKKTLGNKGNYYETFKKWLPGEEDKIITKTDLEMGNSYDE